MKTAIVETIPRDAENKGSINLGFEIVSDMLKADRYMWFEKLNGNYDIIAFNVFYPMHIFNISPFLKKNNIEPLRSKRNQEPYIVAGGQGIGFNGILSEIVDEEFIGEYDWENNKDEIVSKPAIKYGKAVIEITRGCKYRCKFCEYSWGTKKYREKPLELIEQQIEYVRNSGVRDINFLSANFAGYKRIDELMMLCKKHGVSPLNTDSVVRDIPKLLPYLDQLPRSMKIGIETFDEKTRLNISKNVTDSQLEDLVDKLLKRLYYIHFYLIYGLPNDNYESWFRWIEKLSRKRKEYSVREKNLFGEDFLSNKKKIRFEFNITNFEPCTKTPFENESEVDFREKDKFVDQWFKALIENGYRKGKMYDSQYKNSGGRIGRKKTNYQLLMLLKKSGPELTEKILNSFPSGVSRSLRTNRALNFLESVNHA